MPIHFLALVTFILFLSTQIGVPSLPRLSAELGANPQEMAAVLSATLLFRMLDSEKQDDRLTAIETLGEIGDADALQVLRARLKKANAELATLIAAVGKLKRKLGVK